MKRIWLAFLILCMSLGIITAEAAEPFELHMLDVGQGQSVLVEANGHYMLLDGGGRGASSYVVTYLKQQEIERLDVVAVSHYDEDHMAGLIGALSVFRVGTLLLPSYAGSGELYRSFAAAALSNGCKIEHAEAGQSFLLGEADVSVVGPVRADYAAENDRSLAFKITFGKMSCLICGDAERQSEMEMAGSVSDLKSDVYVVNHHGSSTSSTDALLDAVMPAYALLSCGKGNDYGHPAIETLYRLRNHGCQLFRTDCQGAIVAYSDGDDIWFSQEPCDDWTAGSGSVISGDVWAADAPGNTGHFPAELFLDKDFSKQATALEETVKGAGEAQTSCRYICNTKTRKFHYPSCTGAIQMKEENRLYTDSDRDTLVAQGYEPCGICRP